MYAPKFPLNFMSYQINPSRFKKLVIAMTVIFLAMTAIRAQQIDFAQVKARDLSGQQVQPLAKSDAKAVVFIFIQTDCPLSNRYAPEIKRLYEKYNSGVVTFWLVYPDREDSAETIQKHLKEFGYKMDALRDVGLQIVKASGATVTPEAAVFVSSKNGMSLIYRGRIDDLVAAFGKTRAEATKHDLDETLAAITGGKTLESKITKAIGCYISHGN